MIIDVSSILKEFGGEIRINGEVKIPDTRFGGSDYSFLAPAKISGKLTNNGTTLILEADCDAVMNTQCARCLKNIEANIHFHITETLMKSDEIRKEYEDIIVFDGNTVSLDEIVENNFIMNVSSQYLCREDCKGLCPKCGADLNTESCNCTEDDIDPRWAALADMIKNKD